MIYDCVRLKRKISRKKDDDEESKMYSIINQIIFIFLQFSSCIIYLLRELKMEGTVAVSIFSDDLSEFIQLILFLRNIKLTEMEAIFMEHANSGGVLPGRKMIAIIFEFFARNVMAETPVSYIFVCNLSMILFILMMRTTGLLRFVNGWHNANRFISTLASKTFHLGSD